MRTLDRRNTLRRRVIECPERHFGAMPHVDMHALSGERPTRDRATERSLRRKASVTAAESRSVVSAVAAHTLVRVFRAEPTGSSPVISRRSHS